MRTILSFFAISGLILTLLPAILLFSGKVTWNQHAWIMLMGMILWFIFAPLAFRQHKIRHQGERNENMD